MSENVPVFFISTVEANLKQRGSDAPLNEEEMEIIRRNCSMADNTIAKTVNDIINARWEKIKNLPFQSLE